MMLAKNLMASAGNAAEELYVDDVFSTWLYNGNGSTQTITNGVNLAGDGGMVWTKARSTAGDNAIYDTVRGATKELVTSQTTGEGTFATSLTAFNSTGFTLGNSTISNTNGQIYASWTFRNAPKFFTHTVISHTNGTATNISLSELGEVGMVVAKTTTTIGDWITWHRSLTAGNNLRLSTTAAQSTTNAWLSVSGTTATLASAAPTGTYVIYAWAHDTSADGFVQCGSFTYSGSPTSVSLGWEPQFVIIKAITASTNSLWHIMDTLRGNGVGTNSPSLKANSTDAEFPNGGNLTLSATGFAGGAGTTGSTMVYLAIRMPNKPPTSGTEVFQPVTYTGTNVDNRLVNMGIKTDMILARVRSLASTPGFVIGDRLRGQPYLGTATANAELADADSLDQQIVSSVEYGTAFSSMTGFFVGNDPTANLNANTTTNNHIAYAFKRALGFFDEVCYTGTGTATSSVSRLIPHQLGVVPELTIIKGRTNTASHIVSVAFPSAQMLRINGVEAATTSNNVTNLTLNGYAHLPTSTSTELAVRAGSAGNFAAVDASSVTYVAYLFATLAGVSKVGSYTGTGTTLQVDCGFTGGARFVLIKRADDVGDWYVWDSARGIVSGNDSYLLLNSTAAEVTSTDHIDTYSAGFEISSTAPAAINASGGTFIFFAIA